MSRTLEKMMMLKQMSANQQPQPQFEMDPNQQRQAEADAMMQMAQMMGNPQIQGKGVDRTLKALVAGMGPAYGAYSQSKAHARKENMGKYELEREQEKEARREAMDIMKMERDEAKAARDEAYNQQYLSILSGRGRGSQASLQTENYLIDPNTGDEYDVTSFPAINTKNTRDKYIKDADNLGMVVNKLDHISELMDEYENMHPDEYLNPRNDTIKKYTNEFYDKFSRLYANDTPEEKVVRLKEFVNRRLLGSELKQLTVASEKAAKGGVMSQGFYDRLKDAYADENEPIPLIKGRLQSMREELVPNYKSKILSATTGRAINPNRANDFPDSLVDTLQRTKIKRKGAQHEAAPLKTPESPIVSEKFKDISTEELLKMYEQQ